MWVHLLAQTMSPGERIGALHDHFASRTTADGLQVLYTTLIVAVLLCAVLVLLHRIQQANERRRERAREEARQARTSAAQLPRTSGGLPTASHVPPIDKRPASRQSVATHPTTTRP